MTTATNIPHVHLDQRGVAWIDDTNVKVIEVVLDRLVYGFSRDEIHFQHPHLSLAQIHGALSHYYDNQAEFDREIEHQYQTTRDMAAKAVDSPLRKKLESLGSRT
jgi:uncharacterized protein (DUF433 family)